MSIVAKMYFNTNMDKITIISVPRAKDGLTAAEVKEAMDRIIASGAVSASTGKPVSRQKAELISTTVVPYSVVMA